MFQVNEADREMDFETFKLSWRWGAGVRPNRDRPVFALFPREGAHRMMDSFGRQAREFGREGSVFYLGDEPLRVSDVNALGRLRREMANGTASPGDVRRFEARIPLEKGAMPLAKRFRPGYTPGESTLHHFIEVGADNRPAWEEGHVARALCGADVSYVEPNRPLWKAAGEPCRHCSKIFRETV
jgi:hypothetical protein